MRNNKLFHLSFNGELEGVWSPRKPDGLNPGDPGYIEPEYPEPDTPRISFSPSIIKCFIAIYQNVKHFFDKENYPHLDFFVYTPLLTGKETIITPQILTHKEFVHDAFLTEEHWVCSKVRVKRIAKIRISKIAEVKKHYYRAFNNPKNKKDLWIPDG